MVRPCLLDPTSSEDWAKLTPFPRPGSVSAPLTPNLHSSSAPYGCLNDFDIGGRFCRSQIGVRGLTLTTHAIVGAAIASVLPAYPSLAIAAAFASHYLLDAIPHWDYPILSDSVKHNVAAAMKYDRALLADMLMIGTDATLGIALALLLLARSSDLALVLCGATAAILPDALQFAYIRFPCEPLISLQRFHSWMHASRNLRGRPILGLSAQVALVLFVLLVERLVASA
jgi:hypothetical protein